MGDDTIAVNTLFERNLKETYCRNWKPAKQPAIKNLFVHHLLCFNAQRGLSRSKHTWA